MLEINYGQMSDEAVIESIRQGHHDGTSYILNKYKSIVRQKARGLYLIGGESEDLIQEGMIGLFEAIQNYDSSYHMTFHSFADMCVTRQMYSAVKASQRKKHVPLNTYVSLNAEVNTQTDDDSVKLADVIPAQKSAEELFIDRENVEVIQKELNNQLSCLEQSVLELYLSGISYAKIAEILDKEPKSIDNALQRIKTKTRRLIE